MKAILYTKCGCSKMIDIADKISTIRVPICDDLTTGKPLQMSYRDFCLESYRCGFAPGTNDMIFIYKER